MIEGSTGQSSHQVSHFEKHVDEHFHRQRQELPKLRLSIFLTQARKVERLDDEERAYQKLEREYTNKTAKAMKAGVRGESNKRGVEGERKAAGGVDGDRIEQQRSGGASKKTKKGRWFD